MRTPPLSLRNRDRGFTLIELLITVMLLTTVVAALSAVLFNASRSKTSNANNIEASQAGRVAIDMIGRDLRSAGYSADISYPANPQPPIAYQDSLQVLISENLTPYPDSVRTDFLHAYPLAYDPSSSPKPFPLNGTTWTPPTRYRTGAETVRWTLDLNNDGLVDATDQADANAVDAQRTPNPDDYELVRQIYGDSTGGVAHNNGGGMQRVGLIRRPGNGVPPIFTVYMKGNTTPWDWSNGPVPSDQLGNIERLEVQIVAPSGKKDWFGHYAESRFHTQVNSLRNTPQVVGGGGGGGGTTYLVDGYVFNDNAPRNLVRDAGEPGIAGVLLQLGTYSAMTTSAGYYSFSVPAGTYWIKQHVPWGYGCRLDSLSVTVPPATGRSFPDSLVPGGLISAFVFEDLNNNGTFDTGELGKSGVKVTARPSGLFSLTDANGNIDPKIYAPTGACSLSVTPPDSFIVTTTNPIVHTIVDHDTLSYIFGVFKPQIGTVKGTVFRDANKNATLDTGEQGVQNVWVGVTTDGGITVPGYAYTDADGNYSIEVPANDPPHNTPYSILMIPPAGYFPTSPTSINNIWLQAGQTRSSQNFGVASFTVIQLQANRVLSLASGDVIENDWNGNHTENRHGDNDIILGSDTGGSDQVSAWFNRYSSTPLFNAAPTYTRTAPGAVLSMSMNYLNTDSPLNRPDLVTGCKYAASGNFFVWWCQNSSGNEGYYPTTYSLAYKTSDNGDVQAVASFDCAGGASADLPDIIVGTKSPTANQGSLELWTNNNAASPAFPTFSRTEIYPPSGGLLAGSLGEVNAIALGDLDGDGKQDLVVGTHTGNSSGQVYFFKNMGKTASPHFVYQTGFTFATDAINALAVADVDQDGLKDVVVGTQTSAGGGHLIYLRNRNGAWGFDNTRTVNAPGVVTSLVAADFGGSSGTDLAVGWRLSSGSYVGGLRIYYLDAGTIPVNGVDPSAGALVNWVPALTTNDFNYGLNPMAAAPYLPDLAAGVKVTASTGALYVFVR
jgi:prepilin-type N-terminal cleavage/methylation domain-containing protein